jgi:hypothetical protein
MTANPVYYCAVCHDTFDGVPDDLFHCRTCDHHYCISSGRCNNCYSDAPEKTDLVPLGIDSETFGNILKAYRRVGEEFDRLNPRHAYQRRLCELAASAGIQPRTLHAAILACIELEKKKVK